MEVKDSTLYKVVESLLPNFSRNFKEDLKQKSKEVYSSFIEKRSFLPREIYPFFYSDLASSKITEFIFRTSSEIFIGEHYRKLVVFKTGMESEIYKKITSFKQGSLRYLEEKRDIINKLLYIKHIFNPYTENPNVLFTKRILEELKRRMEIEEREVIFYYSNLAKKLKDSNGYFGLLYNCMKQRYMEKYDTEFKESEKEETENWPKLLEFEPSCKKEILHNLPEKLYQEEFEGVLKEIEVFSVFKEELKNSLKK